MTTDTQTIKYRLIGAAVILISLVLGWWLFLDHDVQRYQDIKRNIPEPLPIERFDIAEPQPLIGTPVQPAESAPVAEPAEETVPEPVHNEPTPAAQPAAQTAAPLAKPDAQGLPEAWVVQAGSFGSKGNADQLQKRMLDANLPAYVKVFNLPEGKRYRVLLGPKLNRQQAESLLPRLQKEFALQGQLLRYQPGFEE